MGELELDVLDPFFEGVIVCFRREYFFAHVDVVSGRVVFRPIIRLVGRAREPPVISELSLGIAAS